MLTKEDNEKLTQVGPGTPMGDLLRRYWHPVAAMDEMQDDRPKPLRLLGEDLVLYRDLNGTWGLIERFCAHRGTDLSLGYVEETGLRCPRHGWLYSESGQCIDMPMEETPFCEEVKLGGYAVAEAGGLVWAYLGPQPAPLVPDWEAFDWDDGVTQVVFAGLPCNWLQCQESSMDPIAVEWLQAYASLQQGPPPLDLQFDFDEFEQGYYYRRKDGETWNVGRTSLWPTGMFVGDAQSCRFQWHVPIDDTHTAVVLRFFDRAKPGAELPEQRHFTWYAQIRDEEKEQWLADLLLNRTFTIWMEQGTVLDRTREHLVDGDRGLMILRDKMFAQMALISDGGEPKAVLRDPASNQDLPLPESKARVKLKLPRNGSFPYLAGQPDDAAAAYKAVQQSWKRKRAPRKPKA